jgi:hypothetical protein
MRSGNEPAWHLFSPEIGPKEAYEVHPECLHHATWASIVAEVERSVGKNPLVAVYPDAGIGWKS